MLSRVAFAAAKNGVLNQAIRPVTVSMVNSRNFSLSHQNDNKYAWHKTAWPAWQMYKDKAGNSASAVFTFGLASYLISKEIFVINDEVLLIFVMGGTAYQLAKAVGPMIGKALDEKRNEILDNMNQGKIAQIAALEKAIEATKEGEEALENRKEFFGIIKSNNEMRLEVEYRNRLQEVDREVKKRLDYQIDLQNFKNSIEEKHISDWVEKQVIASITPKQESDALTQCIKDLDSLAMARV